MTRHGVIVLLLLLEHDRLYIQYTLNLFIYLTYEILLGVTIKLANLITLANTPFILVKAKQ